MTKPSFLCDEHLPNALVKGLVRLDPRIVITRVGRDGAPPHGTSDSDLIAFCEGNGLTLVTHDKETLIADVKKHEASGRKTWGVLLVKQPFNMKDLLECLHLYWEASSREELPGKIDWVPWSKDT